jgi:hypothetical protein
MDCAKALDSAEGQQPTASPPRHRRPCAVSPSRAASRTRAAGPWGESNRAHSARERSRGGAASRVLTPPRLGEETRGWKRVGMRREFRAPPRQTRRPDDPAGRESESHSARRSGPPARRQPSSHGRARTRADSDLEPSLPPHPCRRAAAPLARRGPRAPHAHGPGPTPSPVRDPARRARRGWVTGRRGQCGQAFRSLAARSACAGLGPRHARLEPAVRRRVQAESVGEYPSRASAAPPPPPPPLPPPPSPAGRSSSASSIECSVSPPASLASRKRVARAIQNRPAWLAILQLLKRRAFCHVRSLRR